MSDILSQDYWVLQTRGADGTLVIGATFIFLAYFLHPAVESSYHRVRAYRAWRAIEKRQAVEVTNYSMIAEIFGGRGRWDAARIITALLAVFSLASWGLELSLDLAPYEGSADLLNQPPPVELVDTETPNFWKVKSRDELDYDGNWADLPNMEDGRAKSRYYMGNSSTHTGAVDGEIVVAYWYTEPDDKLFYYAGNNNVTTVVSLNCTQGDDVNGAIDVYDGDSEEAWGSVYSCDQGPSLTDDLRDLLQTKNDTPPTIVMTNYTTDKVFLIVEESSTTPSFLYSIWTVGSESNSIELNHEFHIAATMRLAEAVVTGIVHGETSGGGCFGLLRSWSESREQYDSGITRAFPFGECPNGDSTANIQDIETIEYGLKVGVNALLCFIWLMFLTSIGVVWTVCLRSSVGMDIYDRDELIRAVSLQGVAPGGTPPSEIRIFVRREDTGNISVVISDTGKAHGPCARFLRRGGDVVEDVEPTPVAATVDQQTHGFGGADVPVGPRSVWLEGVRIGMGRAIPGPNGNYRYPTSVALSASPVPSNAGSLVATPISSPARRGNSFLPGGGVGFPAGRGASSIFESECSPVDSEEGTPNDMNAVGGVSANACDGVSGALLSVLGGQKPMLSVSQATSASDIEMPRLSSEGKTSEWRGIVRGNPHMGGFAQDSDEDTEESRYSSDNLEKENPEHSPSSKGGTVGDE